MIPDAGNAVDIKHVTTEHLLVVALFYVQYVAGPAWPASVHCQLLA